jgi:membrane protease YdiL (CAAX protease family)
MKRNELSVTSSMGARNKGLFCSFMLPIFTKLLNLNQTHKFIKKVVIALDLLHLRQNKSVNTMSDFFTSLRDSFIRMSPMAKILLLGLIVLVCLLLSSAFSILLSMMLFHYTLNDVYWIISHPTSETVHVLKLFQIIQSLFLFIVPALFAAWLFSFNLSGYIYVNKAPDLKTLLMVLCSIVIAVPLLNYVTMINNKLDLPEWMRDIENKMKELEEGADWLTKLFLNSKNTNDLAVNVFMIAILPAIGEEFLFRGVLQRLFIEWTKNRHTGVFLVAFLFSFIHLQFYGFVPRFLLGLYFGYLMVWSSSIWVPVAGHFVNNVLAVIYYHFSSKPMGETTMDKIGTEPSVNSALFISIFSVLLILILIYRNEQSRKKRFHEAEKSMVA